MTQSDNVDPSKSTEDVSSDEPLDGFSLDDLGAAYAKAAAEHDPESFAPPLEDESLENPDEAAEGFPDAVLEDLEVDEVVSPEAIIEGALFVGHPENKPLTEERLANLIRGVEPDEVVSIIDGLNQSYRDQDQALRIVRDDFGFKMTIAPEVESVRRSFLGKVRETRLSQSAIEVLSLVAYQPGITAQKVQDQRGRESHSLLNQLVRRQLLEIQRVKPDGGGRAIPQYYPTERFLYFFGIETLEDLPQVEEGLREE
ncbi:Segregation and condensation protein B [Rubripirellula obstinata]|uniref:Segregation and condensation protein B n=1 Tax=Rubripirellula obstinata TaxID=406547 RepID=A0A5B1CE54_9BACT|nr:SMC-Scp complex subunit ScpB [Rubripirellula obstinata]KAA1258501.1 Segregation and condensation protein B [Rubripirellula obstinata]